MCEIVMYPCINDAVYVQWLVDVSSIYCYIIIIYYHGSYLPCLYCEERKARAAHRGAPAPPTNMGPIMLPLVKTMAT